MSVPGAVALLPCLLMVGLAGCSGADLPDAGVEPIRVTAPDDYSYLDQADAMSRPHMHDYWGGKDRIELFEFEFPGDVKAVAPAFVNYHVASFRPPEGRVVPQGTANVTIEVSYQPAVGDQVGQMTMDIETSDSERPTIVAGLEGPVRITTTLRDADVPHQSLSAWRFSIWSRDNTYLRANGTFHVRAEAERGLEIPLFPGHPDPWNGRSEIRLFEDSGVLMNTNIPSPEYCSAILLGNCYWTHRPADGITVPSDTAYIEVRLVSPDPWATPLALHYHGADSWDFRRAEPVGQWGTEQVFHLPVQGNGDSPYAVASLWEFLVVAQNRALELGHFTVNATAFREPPLVPMASGISDRSMAGTPKSSAQGWSPGTGPHETFYVTPNESYPFTIASNGKPLEVTVRNHNGIVRGGILHGPGTCSAEPSSDNIIVGLSTYGNLAVHGRCGPVPAGRHAISLESGDSAFLASIHLTNATFA